MENKGTEVMGHPIGARTHVWLAHLLPNVTLAAVYVLHVSCTSGSAYQLAADALGMWTALTLLVFYMPSLVYFIMTVSNLQFWEQYQDNTEAAKWFLFRLAQLAFFPIWGIYRFAKQIFWSVEAVLQESPLMEEALAEVTAPSRIELFLYMEAFLQCAPQSLLQIYCMLYAYTLGIQISWAQVQLVITSLIIMATNVASFQRFESQKVKGRVEPWKKSTKSLGTTEEPLVQPSEAATRHSDTYISTRPSVPDAPAPPRPASAPVPISRSSYRTMPLPSRKKLVKAMDEDEPLGKLIAMSGWFFHLLCRVLSIASFAHFHLLLCLGVVAVHYAIMLAHLLQKTRCPNLQTVFDQLCLAYIYIFAVIEYRIKFTKTPAFYSFYFILVGIENLAMSIGWYMFDEWEGFWYNYIFIFIFVSYALCILCAFVYFNIFKPKSKLYDPSTLSNHTSATR